MTNVSVTVVALKSDNYTTLAAVCQGCGHYICELAVMLSHIGVLRTQYVPGLHACSQAFARWPE